MLHLLTKAQYFYRDIPVYSKLNSISSFVAFWQIAYFTKRGHNVCKDTFSVLFPFSNPIYDVGRQSHGWSHSLGLGGTRNSFSLLNPAEFGFLVWFVHFLLIFGLCSLWCSTNTVFTEMELCMATLAGWSIMTYSLLMDLLYCVFKDAVFKYFWFKITYMKYDEVLYQLLSQLGCRCNFKVNSVVLEKVYTSTSA